MAGPTSRCSRRTRRDTAAEYDTIKRVRTAVHMVSGAEAIVGGPSAENLDTEVTTRRDEKLVIPLVLVVVVLIILGLLLRAVLAPLVLMATVVVSFAAAFGGSVFVFDTILGFKGVDYSVPLLAFLFLVALGVDYNIFLASRAREETLRLGTREGILKALSATGGVITSAGLVLAATFGVLVTLPLVMLVEVGFLVAFGVLLDALLVRSVLVPALTLLIDRRMWWPSRLSRPATELPNGRQPLAGRRRVRAATVSGAARTGSGTGLQAPSRIPSVGPTVAALWSCATRQGWGKRIPAACPGGEPRGAMAEGHRPLSRAAPPGRVRTPRCPPLWWAAR